MSVDFLHTPPVYQRQITSHKTKTVKQEMVNDEIGSKRLIQLSLLPISNPKTAHFNWVIKKENGFEKQYETMSFEEYRKTVEKYGEFSPCWAVG